MDELDIYALIKRIEKVENADVNERLQYIEQHLKYFVYAATEMKDKFASGIKIGIDQSSINIASSINQHLKGSVALLEKECCSIRELRREIQEDRKAIQEMLKSDSVVGAIKYMAKQLTELTQYVHAIKEEGIKKQIHLDLTMDGYEMVKRKPPLTEPEEIEEVNPDGELQKLLDTLLPREASVLIHRFGLFGEKKKTLQAAAKLFGLTSGESIRRIESKAIRKCRHDARRGLAENITHLELRKVILGE